MMGKMELFLIPMLVSFVHSHADDITDRPITNTIYLNVSSDISTFYYWSLSTVSDYPDWFDYFDDLTVDSIAGSNYAKEYFSNHSISLERLESTKGVWVAFFTPYNPPVFGQPFPYIKLSISPPASYERLTLNFYIHGSAAIRIYPNGADRNEYVELRNDEETPQMEWNTYSLSISKNFEIELRASNYSDGDFILIDKVIAQEFGAPITSTMTTIYTSTIHPTTATSTADFSETTTVDYENTSITSSSTSSFTESTETLPSETSSTTDTSETSSTTDTTENTSVSSSPVPTQDGSTTTPIADQNRSGAYSTQAIVLLPILSFLGHLIMHFDMQRIILDIFK